MLRVLLAFLLTIPTAAAQIRVPALPGSPLSAAPLPGLPGLPASPGFPASSPLPGLSRLGNAAQQSLAPSASANRILEQARRLHVRDLLRRHPRLIAADPRGNPIVRGEVLAIDPSAAALARARAAGFTIMRIRSLAALGTRVAELEVPRGVSAPEALRTLRRLDPSGTYDFDDLYTDSGTVVAPSPLDIAAERVVNDASSGRPRPVLGLIDGGIDVAHPAFQEDVIHQKGCNGTPVPSAHGTAVASLMIGGDAKFVGAAPRAVLYAANVFCAKPAGGSAIAIAVAFAWLAKERVPVINVSLVGPANALLRRVIDAVIAHGSLIVAAVGNDGPAAPPLYPAAYPGVIGVTAVDSDRRVLLEAERGPQVMFAAPGAGIDAAAMPSGYAEVRGTSFASPLVAGLLARYLTAPDPNGARAALQKLIGRAMHLGKSGRNPVYGYGLVGSALPARP